MATRRKKLGVWPGSMQFGCEVVGESYRKDAIDSLMDGSEWDHAIRMDKALLRPMPENEYDKNAVAVVIEGKQVGFLSRDNAVRYHAAFADAGETEESECDCLIEGRQLGTGAPRYSVWLDADLEKRPSSSIRIRNREAKILPLYPPFVLQSHGATFMIAHWLPSMVVDFCTPGDEVDVWEKPDSDEIFLFAKGSIGGTGRIGVLSRQIITNCGYKSLDDFMPTIYAAGGRSVTLLL